MSNKTQRTQDAVQNSRKRATIGAALLAIVAAFGIIINFSSFLPLHRDDEEVAQDAPKVTYIPARPSVAPTATPTVNSLKLLAYGSELTSDGFTTYVGDKTIVISADIEPKLNHPPVSWTVSDSESASLVVSDDMMSCQYKALKPTGKNELTVRCYGAETVIPVFLWGR